MYLKEITNPEDIKKLNYEQLKTLAEEIREALMNR